MSIDEQIEGALADMEGSEASLIAKGFPEEQWVVIKDYIASAIHHAHLHQAKAWEETSANLEKLSET